MGWSRAVQGFTPHPHPHPFSPRAMVENTACGAAAAFEVHSQFMQNTDARYSVEVPGQDPSRKKNAL